MTTQTISTENLPVIAHNSTPVITTELLAQLYGTDVDNIRKNFSNNTERFIEGKHFFKLTGEQLKEFRLSVNNVHAQISNKTRYLTLWTERGAARHAKMLDTDQAWEVFEKLEDCYFGKQPTPPQNPRLLLRNTIHAIAKGDRQTYSNLYNRLYRKFQVTSYKDLNDTQCVAAAEFIKSLEGEYIPRDKIEAPKPTFALADGQHYIVVKDGEPLYRYLLSSEVTDSCLKTMQQPTLNLQGLDLLKGEVDYWQVRKALNVLNSLIYQYQPYNHVKPVFNIISAAENMLCRLWTMIDESSTRLGYLQAVAKTGKPLNEANMDTLAYIQVALTNRMMKVQMPTC